MPIRHVHHEGSDFFTEASNFVSVLSDLKLHVFVHAVTRSALSARPLHSEKSTHQTEVRLHLCSYHKRRSLHAANKEQTRPVV